MTAPKTLIEQEADAEWQKYVRDKACCAEHGFKAMFRAGAKVGLEMAAERCEREAAAFHKVPVTGKPRTRLRGWALVCTSCATWIRALLSPETGEHAGGGRLDSCYQRATLDL